MIALNHFCITSKKIFKVANKKSYFAMLTRITNFAVQIYPKLFFGRRFLCLVYFVCFSLSYNYIFTQIFLVLVDPDSLIIKSSQLSGWTVGHLTADLSNWWIPKSPGVRGGVYAVGCVNYDV